MAKLLTSTLFFCCIGTCLAAPLDASDTVYPHEIPCSRVCQAFMALSGSLLPQQETPPEQSTTPQVVQRPPKLKALATDSAPPREIGEGKAEPPEITGSLSVSGPTSGSETGTRSEQGLTAPAVGNFKASSKAPSQQLNSDTQPSIPLQAAPRADVETSELASENAEQRVAILLVRPEIKSVSDLAKKTVAIDVSLSDSVASARIAIVAAGATDVQMSEGITLAFERVMDGEVSAAVVSVAHPKTADAWSVGRQGFKIFRIPLSPAPLSP